MERLSIAWIATVLCAMSLCMVWIQAQSIRSINPQHVLQRMMMRQAHCACLNNAQGCIVECNTRAHAARHKPGEAAVGIAQQQFPS
jgi:hypothetical protein